MAKQCPECGLFFIGESEYCHKCAPQVQDVKNDFISSYCEKLKYKRTQQEISKINEYKDFIKSHLLEGQFERFIHQHPEKSIGFFIACYKYKNDLGK